MDDDNIYDVVVIKVGKLQQDEEKIRKHFFLLFSRWAGN